jgi:two-component system response regulator FlrC
MKLLIVALSDHVASASDLAKAQGAQLSHVTNAGAALEILGSGGYADLLLVEHRIDVSSLSSKLQDERISTPIVVFGPTSDGQIAAAAIQSGAKEYIPLPPTVEAAAALLATLSKGEKSSGLAGLCAFTYRATAP